MAIVQELNESYFIERFREMGRGDQYTYAAKQALYEYYDNLSDELGEDIKLDVIAICCDWYESTPAQALQEYGIATPEELEGMEEEEVHALVLEYFEGETTAIDCGDTILYMAF